MRTKGADYRDKFLFKCFTELPQTAICCRSSDWLDASLSFSSTSRRSFLGIDHQVVFLFHQCISFYNKSKIIGLYYPTDATPQSPQKRTLFVERHTPRKLGNGRTYNRDGLITSLHEGLFCYCCGDLSRKHCFSFNMHTVYFPLVKQKTKNASLSRSFL